MVLIIHILQSVMINMLYSIEVAYKANMVKTSYHDIRNMVEMAKLINHPHKQAFPALEYLWEADVFKLP